MAPFFVSLCTYLSKCLLLREFIEMMCIKHRTQLLLCNTSPSVTLSSTHVILRTPSRALTSHFSSPGSNSTSLLATTTWFPPRILNETSSTQWHSFSSSALHLSWYYYQLHCLDLEPSLLYLLTLSCPLISLMLKPLPFPACHTLSYQRIFFGALQSWGVP